MTSTHNKPSDVVANGAPTGLGASLELRGLHKRLGGRTVVDDVGLNVARGELVSLLGPSGCGKTTTLRLIAGFLVPDRGRVIMAGHDVTDESAARRPSAMVFQNYALWPHMSVAQNVSFPLRAHHIPKADIPPRVLEALELVGLSHLAESRPTKISGGEQQRVALARALVQRPDILLLDEPLSNLDAKLRIEVRDEIRRIQQELDMTTVLVTHDQDEALSVSDRIAVMHDGKLEQVAAPQQLYSAPATQFIASFVGSTNVVPRSLLSTVSKSALNGYTRSGPLRDDDVLITRPESIEIFHPERPDTIAGRVILVHLRGHFTEVVIHTPDGTKLHTFCTENHWQIGDDVGVRIHRVLIYRSGVLIPGANDDHSSPTATERRDVQHR